MHFYKKIILFLFVLGSSLSTRAQEVFITDAILQGGATYNWTSDNIYILDGMVVLEEGGVLNIEAGTVIKALETPTFPDANNLTSSGLIIAAGARINAIGQPDAPIIFTSFFDDVNVPDDLSFEDRGLWGGLVLCGRAPVGSGRSRIALPFYPETDDRVVFGGDEPTDTSGILEYVSIRHTGAEAALNEELNALTLAGVGSGTQINHIEVFASQDDGIAIEGGTVNLKYITSSFNGDDAFDYDLGWQGKGQFWLAILDRESQGRTGEFDGAAPDDQTPFSKPVIYNATFIGQGADAVDNPVFGSDQESILFRDASGGILANSIFTEFPGRAIEVEDRSEPSFPDARLRMEQGDLQLLNNLWWAVGNGQELNAGPNGLIQPSLQAEDSTAQFLVNHLNNNGNEVADPQFFRLDWTDQGLLDPRPALDGPAYQNLASYPNDPFFTVVAYKGAFGADNTDWLFQWSALDTYSMFARAAFGGTVSSTSAAPERQLNWEVYPNPASEVIWLRPLGSDFQEIQDVVLYDLSGRPVRRWNTPGTAGLRLSVEGFAPGMYVLQLWSEGKRESIMVVVE